MKRKIIIGLVAFNSLNLFSEKPIELNVGVEYGSNYVTGELYNNWSVRQDVGHYYDSYSKVSSAKTEMNDVYFGIKPEISFYEQKLSLSSGLRYNKISSSMSSDKFFYLRYTSTASQTEFARVRRIDESNHYLGIPLELKYAFYEYQNFGAYVKAGTQFSYLLASTNDLTFLNEHMNSEDAQVYGSSGLDVNPFYSTFYSSIGVKYARSGRATYSLELLFPSFYLTRYNSTIVEPQQFSGFVFSIYLPVKSFIIK